MMNFQVSVANWLFPKGRVSGGSPKAVAAAMALVRSGPRVIVKELQVTVTRTLPCILPLSVFA